ncbi:MULTISPECIES: hypothetical protein [Micromonospora]|uniref:hypothetical protein n=1 Tax=Micromonospora TaxID=1873 RepID=UPI001B39BFF3|nr:hypothetical protein [Micromonospora sp. M61]MBQ0977953.1 hypothetical protein [Micromonospora sp. M61]WTI22299.1 hypothetical protein OG886_04125 [Micromonospora zamorensis]
MIDYRCSGCRQRYTTYLPEPADERCYLCAAKATWESLPPETQRAIDGVHLAGLDLRPLRLILSPIGAADPPPGLEQATH